MPFNQVQRPSIQKQMCIKAPMDNMWIKNPGPFRFLKNASFPATLNP